MLYQGVVFGRLFTVLLSVLCAVTTLFSPRAFAANAVLAWNPSPSTNVVAYKVYYGGISGIFTNSVQVGAVTNATVTGLAAGVTYYFSATAVNGQGAESDFSNETSHMIPIPVNQPPTLNAIAAVTINENAGAQSVSLSGISSGASNEVQTLTVTVSSSNPGLIPTPAVSYTSPNATGTLTFTPVALGFGTATVTVTVSDGGASNNIVTRSFLVTVNPVNQSPTLNALANVTINENAGVQTVNLSGISSGAANEVQTLTVTASSSNPGLIPNPTVAYTSPTATGTISLTPVAFAFGSATLTITVNDGGLSNNIVTRTFTVTVNPVNQTPTLNALANVTVNENAGAQTVNLSGIGSGAANENQTLTVTASSSNPGLIPTPTVNYTSPNASGSLTFTPAASAGGSSTITVTVNDGGTNNNIVTRTFVATVNRLPVISVLTNQVIAMNSATIAIPFTISDTETSANSLTLSASSSNPTLVVNAGIVFAGTGGNRTVTITPVAGQSGIANITITVDDGFGSASRTFALQVLPPPAAPSNLRVVQASP